MRSLIALLSVFAWSVAASADANWPQWRGPTGDGVADDATGGGAPSEWSPTESIAWRAPLPGPAGATPIVWGDKLLLTTADGAELKLLAYATADGKPLWERTVTESTKRVRGDEGNYASPSPVTDGEHVVALMGDGQMACYRLDGTPVWELNLQERYGRFRLQFGYTSSPVLSGDRLYVQMIHGDGDPESHEAQVACLDLATGDEVWSVGRVTGASMECEHAYTSPLLRGEGADAELITHGADWVVAYDPADGSERWRLGGMNPPGNYHPTLRFVASPAIGPDVVIVPTAKRGPVFAVRPGGSGDVTGSDRVLWRLERKTPDVPTPLVHDGLVYLCSEAGVVTCVDAKSGDVAYSKRIKSDRYRASPVVSGDKLYLTSREGVVTVLATGREFRKLAQNDMGEAISSSPVIVGDTIYLRTFEALYAVRSR